MEKMLELKIINLLKKEDKSLSVIEISNLINEDIKEVNEELKTLISKTKIRITKKGKYELTKLKFGNIKINNKGFGFLDIPNEKSIYISKENLMGAIDKDYVSVSIIDPNEMEGKIVRVINHDKDLEIGEIYLSDNEYYAKLDDINKKSIIVKIKNINIPIVNGSKVKIALGNLIKKNVYEGEVKDIICHVNDPESDIICKAEMFDISTKFGKETLDESYKVPTKVFERDLFDREDLRNKRTFTIDGDNSKDFDDAVSIDLLDNGNYLLGVHIADVAHYIKKGSYLDREASTRALSSYFANRVIPMLPPMLSNGICSLNPNVDRLTKSCEIELNKNGEIINYRIFDSVICSKKRMTYNKVNDVISDKLEDESYLPFLDDLINMKKLSDAIRKKRKSAGSIDFDTKEMEIVVDENGKVMDVLNLKRIDSEKIIEDFMITANVCVAEYFNYMDIPSIYRIHEEPKRDNIEEFFRFLKTKKEKIGKLPRNITSRFISDMLETLKEDCNSEIYSDLVLKSMKKAKYSVDNRGHFGLAENNYLHFTSPIRRYSDLVVHRLIDEIKEKKNFEFFCSKENIDYLNSLANHISKKEDNSVKCEREINKMKAAEYMQNNIGNTYNGKIVSINEKGMYVDIYNGIEGLIRFDGSENVKYNKENYFVTINRDQYRIGDIIEVMLVSSDKFTGHIDLIFKKYEKKLVRKH